MKDIDKELVKKFEEILANMLTNDGYSVEKAITGFTSIAKSYAEDKVTEIKQDTIIKENEQLKKQLSEAKEFIWTDELVKEMIYSKLPIPDHYIGNVQKCLDEFKESEYKSQ